MSGEVTHHHVVLFDAFFIRDDFHVADCTAETLAVEYVVYLGWVATGAVCDQVCVSFLDPGVAYSETIGYGKFQDSLTFCVMGAKAVGVFEHTSRSANMTIPVTHWDKYLSGWDLGPVLCQPACSQNLNLQSLPVRVRTWGSLTLIRVPSESCTKG